MIVNVVSHDVMERVVPGKPCSLRAEGSLIQLRHSKPYLSMGAVFAVFAAFYYWIEKMIGLQYNNLLANVHFFVFFIGVNLTFMPLHFLGLAGMPRRIADFPDFYTGWNQVASFGSSVSLFATFIFFYVVYDMLVYGAKGRKAPYALKVITQLQLCSLFLTSKINLDNKKFSSVTIKGLFFVYFTDAAKNWQFGFQDPASSIMEGIVDLHHDIMFFIVWIVIAVVWIMFDIIKGTNFNSIWSLMSFDEHSSDTTNKVIEGSSSTYLPTKIQHNTFVEIVWTLLPCVVLLLIAIPSFSLLYAVEDFTTIESSIKIIGNQWYWTYEFPGNSFEKSFDSVMIPEMDLKEASNGLRLLEVDNRLLLPIEKQIRLFITSTDVLHSWAVPSLGVKMDACPGRLNQVALWINRRGTYYGQCSEICGINHSFMPIVVQSVDEVDFFQWFLDNSDFSEPLVIKS
jgi:cytochrome c oxidase subunit II